MVDQVLISPAQRFFLTRLMSSFDWEIISSGASRLIISTLHLVPHTIEQPYLLYQTIDINKVALIDTRHGLRANR